MNRCCAAEKIRTEVRSSQTGTTPTTPRCRGICGKLAKTGIGLAVLVVLTYQPPIPLVAGNDQDAGHQRHYFRTYLHPRSSRVEPTWQPTAQVVSCTEGPSDISGMLSFSGFVARPGPEWAARLACEGSKRVLKAPDEAPFSERIDKECIFC